jgi:hypothetical protein
LPLIAGAHRLARLLADLCEDWEKNGCENRDNSDDYEQFNERKADSSASLSLHDRMTSSEKKLIRPDAPEGVSTTPRPREGIASHGCTSCGRPPIEKAFHPAAFTTRTASGTERPAAVRVDEPDTLNTLD